MTTLQIHAYDWEIKDKYGEDDQTVIFCWTLDQYSTPYLLRINNFPVFCYIELPLFVRNKFFKWDKYLVGDLISHINSLLKDNQKILKGDFIQAQKIYYYQGSRTHPFIRVYFTNLQSMRNCKYVLNNAINTRWGWMKCNILEDQITVIRKLLTLQNVKYSGWFSVKGTKVDDEFKISTLENEYIINWQTMKPIEDDVCKDWLSAPGVLSWDIECYSDNHLAMPDKYNINHVAYMISAIYKKYKDYHTIKRYGIIIGDCNHIPHDKLAHCHLIHVKDECELVDEFGKIVLETDPEILVGYNILGFDYPYLNHRIKIQIKDWPKMSRIIGEVPEMKTSSWKSSAYGINVMNTLHIAGRISVDLLPIIKRDEKLDTYTLNNVCKYFINKEKYDVSPKEMFVYYEQMSKAIAQFQINPCQEHFDELQRCKKKTTKVMRYCIQDSELVLELMENRDVWVGLTELSNIVGVTIVDIFTKGQQIRCLSQLYDLASRKNYVINQREIIELMFSGGAVKDPIPGLYDNIICLDFKSLYPSIMQAFNICYTTFVHPDHEKDIKDEDCHVIEFDQEEEIIKKVKKLDEDIEVDIESDDEKEAETDLDDDNKKEVKTTHIVHHKFRFFKHKEGLLPLLVKNLVAERNAVRRKQKNEKDPQKWTILEKRQWALKISANSFFGFLGVREGAKLACMEAAMSITAKGRDLIGQVSTYLHDKYNAKIVYGDSVTADTPILCKLHNKIFYQPINQLPCYGYYKFDEKEYSLPVEGLEVWSDDGFTKINKIIRHKTNKKIYKVITHSGVVNVTEDHSLLDQYKNKIKPIDINQNTILLHHNLPKITKYNTLIKSNLNEMINNIDNVTNIELAEYFLCVYDQGLYIDIQINNRHHYEYTLFSNNDTLLQQQNQIIKIIELANDNDYVYDLETENHHFAAGIGRLIVHNTDSVMVDLNIKDSRQCQYWGELLSQEISGVKKGQPLPGEPFNTTKKHEKDVPGLFFSPLEMEFEKAMRLFCIKKKKYAAYLIDDDGTFIKKVKRNAKGEVIEVLDELEMLKKGIVLARRDNNLFLKTLYSHILNGIMNRGHFKDAICALIDTVIKLTTNQIDYKELKSTRELGAHYKQPSFFMKVFSDELRKKNKIVNPGDRLEFLVIENKDAELVGQKMVLVSDYIEALSTDQPYVIDYLHYIEKVLINPIDQLISIGFADYLQKLQHIKYKPPHKRHFLYLTQPTEFILHLVKNKVDLLEFKKMLLHHIDLVDQPKQIKYNIIN